MRDEYNIRGLNPSKNPYTSKVKVTIDVEGSTLDYFKSMAAADGIPYQTLINLYLMDAETYPYMLFHPVDSPDYKEYYGKRFGYSGNVYSRKYKNSASKLCEEAWQVFYGSLVADKFDTVNIRSFKTVWPEK